MKTLYLSSLCALGGYSLKLFSHSRYIETLPILYSSNSFDFLDPDCFHLFLERLSPVNLESIRSVRCSFKMPHFRDRRYNSVGMMEIKYHELIKDLLSLPGLRELKIKFSSRGLPPTMEWWTIHEHYSRGLMWLKPLRQFKDIDCFEVYIPLVMGEKLPRSVDIGTSQLFAVDADGTPYRDYDNDIERSIAIMNRGPERHLEE